MNWFVIFIGTGSIGLFGYSMFLWWRMRKGAVDQPNEFALRAFAQERWMTAGIFGLCAALLVVWAASIF